ncbi:MAG: hypothetical protein R3F14_39250 [Polyangiaceae bacterium]
MDRDELDARIERSLAELGAATAGIEPDAGLTDAVVAAAEKVEPAGDALSGIARATAGLDAEKGLADAVMGRVERGPGRAGRAGRGAGRA